MTVVSQFELMGCSAHLQGQTIFGNGTIQNTSYKPMSCMINVTMSRVMICQTGTTTEVTATFAQNDPSKLQALYSQLTEEGQQAAEQTGVENFHVYSRFHNMAVLWNLGQFQICNNQEKSQSPGHRLIQTLKPFTSWCRGYSQEKYMGRRVMFRKNAKGG